MKKNSSSLLDDEESTTHNMMSGSFHGSSIRTAASMRASPASPTNDDDIVPPPPNFGRAATVSGTSSMSVSMSSPASPWALAPSLNRGSSGVLPTPTTALNRHSSGVLPQRFPANNPRRSFLLRRNSSFEEKEKDSHDSIRLRKFAKRMMSSRRLDCNSCHDTAADLASGGGSGHLEPEVKAVRTSKKLAELKKMDQLTSKRRGRGLAKGTLYGREKETAQLRACLDRVVAKGRPKRPPSPANSLFFEAEAAATTNSSSCSHCEQPPTVPEHPGRRGLVLLKGYSGSGKTALASTLRDPVTKHHKGLYVSGKFDLYLRDAHPYYGIAAACGEICREIANLGGLAHDELQDRITEKLGADVRLLLNVAPEMAAFMQVEMDSSSNMDYSANSSRTGTGTGNMLMTKDFSETGSLIGKIAGMYGNNGSSPGGAAGVTGGTRSSKRTRAKLHYIFRVFMRLVTSYYAPLCIVLDDLQWADPASLDLVHALLTDRDNPQLMIVGLYRSNEVDLQKPMLDKWIAGLKQVAAQNDNNSSNKNNLDITEIEVGNLGLEAVKSISMDILSIDDDNSTQELAELCHRRTQGNIFFLIAFISMLQEKGFLNYDLHNGRYTWDIESIKVETGAASNMVSLMNDKMAELPEDYGLLLSIAACLGSTFDLAKLTIAWTELAKERLNLENETTDSLEKRLSRAIQDGFLENFDEHSTQYRWIHDKVQEAAFTLIPETEWGSFKFHLGETLCDNLSTEALDSSIFLVANLLNEASIDTLNDIKRIHVAELNLQATEKAVSFSAFNSAARYAGRGIELVPANSWKMNYWLTLELHSYAAEAEDFVGNSEKMRSYCDEILNQEACPLIDKLRVYNVLVSSMANLGNHTDAVALTVKVLEELKVKFPKSGPARAIATGAGLVRARARIRSRTPAEIAKMPPMENMFQIEIMRLLDKLTSSTYLSGSDLCPLSIMKCIQLTLQNGLCEFSPPAFAAITFIFTGTLEDPVAGAKMGKYALLLLEKLQSRNQAARTNFIVNFYAFSWTKPFQNLFAQLLSAYEDGLATGDIESAMQSINSFMALSFMAGRSLKQLEADCSNYVKQMKELNRQQAVDFTTMLWHTAQNLMGSEICEQAADKPGCVLGNEEDLLKLHKDNPPGLASYRAQQMRLYATLCEFQKGANLFMAHGYDFPNVAPANPFFMASVFCGGLCCFAMARLTKKGAFKKHAGKARKTIKGWVRQGNPNVKHCLEILNAESYALKRKYKKAEQKYQFAITLAARAGFTNDAALANERYGEFMLADMSDKDGAKYYLEHALKLYAEWGATKKVEMLQKHHKELLQ